VKSALRFSGTRAYRWDERSTFFCPIHPRLSHHFTVAQPLYFSCVLEEFRRGRLD
jgi:hypothetical protein